MPKNVKKGKNTTRVVKKIEFIERKIHILDSKIDEINSKLDSLYDNFLIIIKTIENQNKIINSKLIDPNNYKK